MAWLYWVAIGAAVAEAALRAHAPSVYARLAYFPLALTRRFVRAEASADVGGYRALGQRTIPVVPAIRLAVTSLDGGRARLVQISGRRFMLLGTPGSRSRTGNFLVRITARSEQSAIALRAHELPIGFTAPMAVLCVGVAQQQTGESNPWLLSVLLSAIFVGIALAMRFQAGLGKERALREAFEVIERAMQSGG
jgi:hypothetical protein